MTDIPSNQWVSTIERSPNRNEPVLCAWRLGTSSWQYRVAKFGGRRWLDVFPETDNEEYVRPDFWQQLTAPDSLHETGCESLKVSNLLLALNAKQAKIDALMMEFCPGEMSAEQRAEWAKNQRPVSADIERSITEAFARSPRRVDETSVPIPVQVVCEECGVAGRAPEGTVVRLWCNRMDCPSASSEKAQHILAAIKRAEDDQQVKSTVPISASTGGTASPSRAPAPPVECPNCRTQLAFEGDECVLCKEEAP